MLKPRPWKCSRIYVKESNGEPHVEILNPAFLVFSSENDAGKTPQD